MRVGREPGWSELKVGIITVVAILLLAVLILRVEQRQGIFSKGAMISAHLKDLKGLRLGSPVQFSGVEIGSVKDFKFENDGSVILTMSVKRSVRPLIKTSSRMSIESMGVLGDKNILISAGGADDPQLPEGQLIDTAVQGGTVYDMVADASHIVGDARTVIEQLNAILEKISKAKGTAGKLIDDPALFDETRDLIGKLNKGVADPKLANDLQHAANQLEKLLTATNSQQGSFGKFVYDDKVYKNIEKLTEELTLLAKDIRENPKKYFKVSVF